MPSPQSQSHRTDERRPSKTASKNPGHRPVDGPTGAREQHTDNDDPMLLNPDFGENTAVYEPGDEARPSRERTPNVAIGASFGQIDFQEGEPGPDGRSFSFSDQETRDAVTASAQRGLVEEGGGHSHGREAQVGARLDDLVKQSPENRRGPHQPRGDMPRGK